MFDRALQVVAPHLCFGCSKTGTVLCPSCKYDIVSEPYGGCIVCARPSAVGVCASHRSPIDAAWIVGERNDTLARLIDAYKFERCRYAHKGLAGLMADILPILPEGIVVVPVPTVRAHVRERGYDHALLIAKSIAARRDLRCKPLLGRRTNTRQRGADRRERFRQAGEAFSLRTSHIPAKVLLVDDVVTTGATLHFAAKILKDAGVQMVFAAVIAKQPIT